MNRALPILALCAAAAWLWAAASIDGKWVAKIERQDAQKGTVVTEFTLDLKAEGDRLTGTVTRTGGRRPLVLTIENGKIQGDRFSFTTVQKGRQGEQKFLWEGTVSGAEIKGTRTAEGRRRGTPFTARRSQ